MRAGTRLVQIANAGRYDGKKLSQEMQGQLKTLRKQLIVEAKSNRHPGND
jgi:hypothetical protein